MENEREQVPGICREVGLSCKRCTEDSAASVAAVCKGLRTKAVVQLFHQIYPVSACATMSSHFARSYRAASQGALGATDESVVRKPASGVRPRVAVAVA